ncbi:MAG: PCYCGC motif-containing (lipo)protein [Chloroflexota bacterium]
MAPLAQMPVEVQDSPVAVQEAYRFAVANPDVMKQIPCYCGCGAIGHTSNYACYVKEASSLGSITFDTHALGCSICVDITQDVMRLQQNGKPLEEIQRIIDQTYSKYGSSTSPSQ